LISWGVDTIFGLTGDGIAEFAALPKHQRKLKLVEDAK
jgi:thiamine pyrophosphate-dependent acetolactate synthase large subunit-like protein